MLIIVEAGQKSITFCATCQNFVELRSGKISAVYHGLRPPGNMRLDDCVFEARLTTLPPNLWPQEQRGYPKVVVVLLSSKVQDEINYCLW
jgi:hypothetical protein